MFKHKNALAALMAMVMLFTLTACGKKTETTAQNEQPAEAPAESDMTEWEQSSGIYNTEETDEELYQRALEEGATVTLYSSSSRCTKVADAFMAKYPGIECVPFDISTNELLEKVTREYDAGAPTADVVHIKDQDGSMSKEYVANKVFYNFKPADIFEHIYPALTATATPMYIVLTQLFYNAEAYTDGPPIPNIWQLTEPQWKGKIMMQNPLDNLSWGSWITGFCVGEEPDRLAAAYKDFYGEELKLSDGCENAGFEFLKRLHANEPIFTASSDEIAESVGTPGQKDPPVGFCASSKLRKAEENGWVFAPVNLEPEPSLPAVHTLYIVTSTPHPAAVASVSSQPLSPPPSSSGASRTLPPLPPTSDNLFNLRTPLRCKYQRKPRHSPQWRLLYRRIWKRCGLSAQREPNGLLLG